MGRVIVVAATVGTLVLGIAVPRAHSSEIVFSNLDAAGEYLPNVGTTLGVVSGQDVDFAASFIPSSTYVLESVAAAITHFLGDNAVDLFLMEDLHFIPGAVIESWSFAGLPAGGSTSTELVVGTSVLNPVLQSGVQYWLGASAPANALMSWNWNTTGDMGSAFRVANGGWSGSGQVTGAYRIIGVRDGTAVPEPASLFMLVTGLAGMAAFRRRHHHGAPRMWRSRPDGSSTNPQEDPHAV